MNITFIVKHNNAVIENHTIHYAAQPGYEMVHRFAFGRYNANRHLGDLQSIKFDGNSIITVSIIG